MIRVNLMAAALILGSATALPAQSGAARGQYSSVPLESLTVAQSFRPQIVLHDLWARALADSARRVFRDDVLIDPPCTVPGHTTPVVRPRSSDPMPVERPRAGGVRSAPRVDSACVTVPLPKQP